MSARPTERPSEASLQRLRRGSASLSTVALQRLDEALPWYRAMPPQDRSWVGLVAQAGISAFTSWYRDPTTPLTITADVFGTAPRELTRSVSLSQTLQLVRTIVAQEQRRLEAEPIIA